MMWRSCYCCILSLRTTLSAKGKKDNNSRKKHLGRLIVQGNPSPKCLLGCWGSNNLYRRSLNPTHYTHITYDIIISRLKNFYKDYHLHKIIHGDLVESPRLQCLWRKFLYFTNM
jgi:hypothetical protein